MRRIAIILSVLILAVFSLPPENLSTLQNVSSSPAMRAQTFYFVSQALPEAQFYHRLPLTSYYYLPYLYVQPKLILNEPGARRDVTNSESSLLIDPNLSDEEATRQLEDLKEIYSQNNGDGIVFPSIVPAARGFIALKANALIKFLNNFSLATAVRTKTKIIVYPTIG